MTAACKLLELPRSTYYYVRERLEEGRRRDGRGRHPRPGLKPLVKRIRGLCRRYPTYGYRRICALLRREGRKVNRKRVQRLMRKLGLSVVRRPKPAVRGKHRGRVVTDYSNERWSTDLTKIWCGKDGWCSMIPVVDCHDRECVGYTFARRGRAKEAIAALDEAVLHRFGTGPRPSGLEVRVDNGSQFCAKAYLEEVQALGWRHQRTYYRSPNGNAVVERFIRSLKEECVWLHSFASFEEAQTAIAEWVENYNGERPHSALGYRAPQEYRESLVVQRMAA